MKHSNQIPEELQWQAFCYVTGELDARQAAEFEDRLAEDQTAREALAAAMETLQLVSAVESLEPVQRPAQKFAWKGSFAWMSLGAAAAIALAVGLPAAWHARRDGGWRAAGLTPELAVAWSKSQGDLSVPVDEDQDETEDLFASDSPHVAPAWMVAAVKGLAQHEMPDDPADMPRDPRPEPELEN